MGKGESTFIDVRRFSAETMKLEDGNTIKKAGVCRLDAFSVLENKRKRLLLLAITNLGEGSFLELYEE
jgi:hypothetical protein